MTYAEAKKELKKVGARRATGPAEAAMYAILVGDLGLVSKKVLDKFYDHFLPMSSAEMRAELKRFTTEPFAIFDVI